MKSTKVLIISAITLAISFNSFSQQSSIQIIALKENHQLTMPWRN